MIASSQNFKNLALSLDNSTDEEFSIPLDISDIIAICKEYSKLGMNIQNQMENILEFGIEESIKSGTLKHESLPFMKNFLQQIINNPYFGDAGSQAKDCIDLIDKYQFRQISLKFN